MYIKLYEVVKEEITLSSMNWEWIKTFLKQYFDGKMSFSCYLSHALLQKQTLLTIFPVEEGGFAITIPDSVWLFLNSFEIVKIDLKFRKKHTFFIPTKWWCLQKK